MLLVPQSPPDAGKRETDAVCCPPGSVEKRGTSSLSKVWHGSTSTTFAGKKDSFLPALGLGLLSQLHLVVPREARAVDIRTMPASILLRADQVIEEACLLQRMSLFLAHRVNSLRCGI
jgi:hypothetical protein